MAPRHPDPHGPLPHCQSPPAGRHAAAGPPHVDGVCLAARWGRWVDDGWTMGGCRALGNALVRWGEREGVFVQRRLIEAAHATLVRQWGATQAPRLPKHVVTVFMDQASGAPLAVDGDGAGRPAEVLARCAAIDGYYAPRYVPYRAALCDRYGWDAFSMDDAALDALLTRTLAPYRATLRKV
jgi:hypothetical protein